LEDRGIVLGAQIAAYTARESVRAFDELWKRERV
jgi:hypothetical protein